MKRSEAIKQLTTELETMPIWWDHIEAKDAAKHIIDFLESTESMEPPTNPTGTFDNTWENE